MVVEVHDNQRRKQTVKATISAGRRVFVALALAMVVGIASGQESKDPSDDPVPRVRFGTPAPAPEDEPHTVFPPAQVPTHQLIGLDEALRLAGVENPTIARAENAIGASLAEQTQARALLFPSLSAGANIRLHRGNLLSARGIVRDVDSQSLYAGLGADAKGAGTVAVPGIRIFSHLGDAIYAPQAARFRVQQARFEAVAVGNQILFEVGSTYLALAAAQAQAAALRSIQRDLDEIVKLTANLARTGQGRESDAQRALSEATLLRAEEQRLQEQIAAAAAELSRLLNLDPSVPLSAIDETPPLLDLVDRHRSVSELVQIALSNHPEIQARSAAIGVGEARFRTERARPWLPTISVNFSAGEFGGGSNTATTHFGDFAPRTDFDVYAVWSLQNLTAGNRANQNRARADIGIAEAERAGAVDRVRREVSESLSLVLARHQQIELARRRVDHATRAYQQDLLRIRNLQGRPLELVNSVNLLLAAQQDLIRSMAEYSQAQLRLFVSLGRSPDSR